MRKAVAAAALSATLVTGTAIGATIFAPSLVGAQSDPTTTTTAPADDHGADRSEWLRSTLQPLVDNNTITTAQRDAVIAALEAARPPFGDHPGMGGPGMGRFGMGAATDAIAKVLGIDAATLRSELESGKSLADVAKAHNVDPQTVIDAIVKEATSRIDEAVTAGKLPADAAAKMKDGLTQRVTDMVNGVKPTLPGGMGGMFPGGRHGRGGFGAPGANGTPSSGSGTAQATRAPQSA